MASNGNGSDERNKYQKALLELIGGRAVAYWPVLARRIGGVKAAVMLSQLLYWNGDPIAKERGGWIFKSVSEMEEETGLTNLEQQTARKTLEKIELIEAHLKGVPRIWQYRIDMDKLGDILIDRQTHSTVKPLNGKPIERLSNSMARTGNIDGQSRTTLGRFGGKRSPSTPSNLNKNHRLHNTEDNIQITPETTTTTKGVTAGQDVHPPSDLVVVAFRDAEALMAKIGVWEKTIPEYLELAAANGWTDETLTRMIKSLCQDCDDKRATLLLKHRIEVEKPMAYLGYTKSNLLCKVCGCSPCICDSGGDEWIAFSDGLVEALRAKGLSEEQIDEAETINQVQMWSEKDLTEIAEASATADIYIAYLRNNPRER